MIKRGAGGVLAAGDSHPWVLVTSVLTVASTFTVYNYLGVFIAGVAGLGPKALAPVLLGFGLASAVGNQLSGCPCCGGYASRTSKDCERAGTRRETRSFAQYQSGTNNANNTKQEYGRMCDYSLHAVATRPATIDDNLVTTSFPGTCTREFAAVGGPNVAVCMRPGTELVFENDVKEVGLLQFFRRDHLGKLARFRQSNRENPHAHHDALEFPSGRVVRLTDLRVGQCATVLQLPMEPVHRANEQEPVEPVVPR